MVIFLTFIFTHSLVKQKFNKLQLEVFSLTDYEKIEFLIKEKKILKLQSQFSLFR